MQAEQQPEVGLGAAVCSSVELQGRSRLHKPGSSTCPQGRSAKSGGQRCLCETLYKTEGWGAECYFLATCRLFFSGSFSTQLQKLKESFVVIYFQVRK